MTSSAKATDPASSDLETTLERSKWMGRVRQKDTPAEMKVRSLVHGLGHRYRVGGKDLPGRPDMANRTKGWAIFVNGCFWHAHEGCSRWRLPKRNRSFWRQKFDDNRARDREVIGKLKALGFSVLVVWECELEEPGSLKDKLVGFLQHDECTSIHEAPDAQGDQMVGYERISSVGDCQLEVSEQEFLRSKEPPELPEKPEITVVAADLFCGCGGLSVGIRQACVELGLGFEIAFAVDTDEDALTVYKANLSPKNTARSDICTILNGKLGESESPEEAKLVRSCENVQLLLAGPPCQGHSNLNNHTRREDPRNRLYEKIGRFAELIEPTHIIAENVPAVVHGRDGALDRTIDHLESLGYKVESGAVQLWRLGVPQRRKRHVVVASLVEISSVDEIVKKYELTERTLEWAISDLEDEYLASDDPFRAASQSNETNRERMEHLFQNDLFDLPNHKRPDCHQDGDHSYKSMYGRLRWNKPAQTITSGFLSPGQGRFIHPSRQRTLTPHEAARLQFFPDWFEFSGAVRRRSLARMIGNAVPMKLSYAFGVELLSQNGA